MPDDQVQHNDPRPLGERLFTGRALERRAAAALAKRRADGEVMYYVQDGWMVRETPGQGIERLCLADEFHAEDYP